MRQRQLDAHARAPLPWVHGEVAARLGRRVGRHLQPQQAQPRGLPVLDALQCGQRVLLLREEGGIGNNTTSANIGEHSSLVG